MMPTNESVILCVSMVTTMEKCSNIKEGEDELEKRSANRPGYVPLEVLARIENALKNRKEQDDRDVMLGEGRPGSEGSLDEAAYAKATCTSYPGKVVCQLGRYTFVINNGEHKMDPDVIERFAAMVYHRSQEGDSSFDVSVDIPTNLNPDYFVHPNKFPAVESSTTLADNSKSPVFVECSPVLDDRKTNRHYPPSEIVYSCKKKELGVGRFQGFEKRMIISVNDEGVVSAGDLVLPYTALLDKRFKRQRGQEIGRAELRGFNSHFTSPTLDNKLYGIECTSSMRSWCPSAVPNCPNPEGPCATVNTVQSGNQASVVSSAGSPNQITGVAKVQNAEPMVNAGSPNVGSMVNPSKPNNVQTGAGVVQNAVPVGVDRAQHSVPASEIGNTRAFDNVNAVGGAANSARVEVPQNDASVGNSLNSGPAAIGGNSNPQIGVGTPNDVAQRSAVSQNVAAPLAVTQNVAAQPQQVSQDGGQARRVQDPGIISADDRSGEAAIYAVSKMPPPMVRVFTDVCGRETLYPWCPRSAGYSECTISGCVTLPECPPSGRKPGMRERREEQRGKKPMCPVSRYRLNRMRTSRRLGQRKQPIRKRKRQVQKDVSGLCTTACSPPSLSCVVSCKIETSPQCTPQTQSTPKECTTMCMNKRDIKRKRKRINHLLWPTEARERYILE